MAVTMQPDLIRKILVHLKLWEEFFLRRPPPMSFASKSEVATGSTHEAFDDGWSSYDEPWVEVHSL